MRLLAIWMSPVVGLAFVVVLRPVGEPGRGAGAAGEHAVGVERISEGVGGPCRHAAGDLHVIAVPRRHVDEQIASLGVGRRHLQGCRELVFERDFHPRKPRLAGIENTIAVCVEPHSVADGSAAQTRHHHDVPGTGGERKRDFVRDGGGNVHQFIHFRREGIVDGDVERGHEALVGGQRM